jgi:hypothetical protein
MPATHSAACSVVRRSERVDPGSLLQHELAVFEERRCVRLVFIGWIPVGCADTGDFATLVVSDRVRQNEGQRLRSNLFGWNDIPPIGQLQIDAV